MKRWEIVLAICGAAALIFAASRILVVEPSERTIVVAAAGCRTPVTVIEPPPKARRFGAAFVIHGLSANRRIMEYLGADFAADGFRVFMPDLPGHGDNTDPFSFSRAETCARATLESLIRSESLSAARTVIVGHSMGGAFAVRMADTDPVAATVAISPAPMVSPRRMPANLLVFSAQLDVWQLADEARALQKDAGGDRTSHDDFQQMRAFGLDRVPWATHTSMLSDAAVADRAESWAEEAVSSAEQSLTETKKPAATAPRPAKALPLLSIIGALGIVMIVPALISMAVGIASGVSQSNAAVDSDPPRGSQSRQAAHANYALLLMEGAVCALVSVLLLMRGIPLRFVHLYSGDYLASALLIVGLLMLLLNWNAARAAASARLRPLIGAGILGFAMILSFGAWFNWHLTDLWMNEPRWVSFLKLLPFLVVFCFAEEVFLGPVGRGKTRTARFATAIAIRSEIWLAIVLGYFVLASGEIVLPILVLPFAGISIAQRLIADGVRARTASATAAAVFDAILAAWFIAAVFPIT